MNGSANPQAKWLRNTHDLHAIGIDGTGLTLITEPGPISIVPDWRDDLIIYMEISEKHRYAGATLIGANGAGQRRIKPGASSPKWIPRRGLIRQ